MREIKFDIILWDPGVPETVTHYNFQEALPVGFIDFDNGVIKPIDNCVIIREYTGLKDKNGREIYEGDIFEYVTPISHSKYRKSVQYEESEACWILWDGNPDYQQSRLKSGLASRGVVIGNVYENPYLLKP